MSHVMQARLPTVRSGPPDPGVLAQPSKDLLELGERDGAARAGTEEGRPHLIQQWKLLPNCPVGIEDLA
jgi:hypothetical protein